jgi:hypothetical protein
VKATGYKITNPRGLCLLLDPLPDRSKFGLIPDPDQDAVFDLQLPRTRRSSRGEVMCIFGCSAQSSSAACSRDHVRA